MRSGSNTKSVDEYSKHVNTTSTTSTSSAASSAAVAEDQYETNRTILNCSTKINISLSPLLVLVASPCLLSLGSLSVNHSTQNALQ